MRSKASNLGGLHKMKMGQKILRYHEIYNNHHYDGKCKCINCGNNTNINNINVVYNKKIKMCDFVLHN